jgi:hypothetical protein
VAKTSSTISASETPSIRIVFCTVRLVDPSQGTDLLDSNWMWDVRKALPVTASSVHYWAARNGYVKLSPYGSIAPEVNFRTTLIFTVTMLRTLVLESA